MCVFIFYTEIATEVTIGNDSNDSKEMWGIEYQSRNGSDING